MISRSGALSEKVLYCTGPLKSNTRRSLSFDRQSRALRICVAETPKGKAKAAQASIQLSR